MKKDILLLTDADTTNSSIEHHQIKWLIKDYSLDVIGPKVSNQNKSYINYYEYNEGSFLYKNIRKILLLSGLYKSYTINKNVTKLFKKINNKKYDLIIVHHLRLLPIADLISRGSKIIFYAHEHYLSYNQDLYIWRILIGGYWNWISKNYLNISDMIVTVNKSIAELYEKEYSGKVYFLHNLVPYKNLKPKKVNPERIRIIHHGLASTSRKIELMIDVMNYLDHRFELDLVLVPYSFFGKLYIKKLKKLAAINTKIRFPKPVSFQSIEEFGNKYDIGMFFMPPSNRNEELSLGHKFFQYIQSRLALAISPLPEMKNIVERYKIGIVSENYDPKSLATALNQLTGEEIYKLKVNSNIHAKTFDLNFNNKLFISYVEKMLK